MATPTHTGRACLCRAHVSHPSALPGRGGVLALAAPTCCTSPGAALPLKTLGGGQPLLHHKPWPRTGLGQLRAVLVGNLRPWEQRSRGGGRGGERARGLRAGLAQAVGWMQPLWPRALCG